MDLTQPSRKSFSTEFFTVEVVMGINYDAYSIGLGLLDYFFENW